MKRKIRLGILVLALAALVAYCLGGCGVTVEQILNVVAPSEAPTPDVNITFGSPLATAAEPLQLECGEIDGVFSPFWAESDGDAQIVKMTQLSLLAVAGNQSPSEISRAVNADGSVTVNCGRPCSSGCTQASSRARRSRTRSGFAFDFSAPPVSSPRK